MSKRSWTRSDIEPRFEPIGTRDIISTPPEMTRSSWPDHTAAAALKFVCIDEPHWRSTVVPGTVSGQPATIGTMRPMFQPCSPTCVTQPSWTSSISPGSTPRIDDSVPFLRPIGERTASTISASGIHDRVEAPRPHAFQLVLAAVLELDLRAPYEILDRAGNEDLAGGGKRRDTGAGADDDPCDLPLVELALPRVNSCPELEPDRLHRGENPLRAPDRPCRPVERCEEPIAGRVALDSPIAGQLPAHECVVTLEEVPPGAISQLSRAIGRAHDVREEHRRQHRVRHDDRPVARDERLDLVDDLG